MNTYQCTFKIWLMCRSRDNMLKVRGLKDCMGGGTMTRLHHIHQGDGLRCDVPPPMQSMEAKLPKETPEARFIFLYNDSTMYMVKVGGAQPPCFIKLGGSSLLPPPPPISPPYVVYKTIFVIVYSHYTANKRGYM